MNKLMPSFNFYFTNNLFMIPQFHLSLGFINLPILTKVTKTPFLACQLILHFHRGIRKQVNVENFMICLLIGNLNMIFFRENLKRVKF